VTTNAGVASVAVWLVWRRRAVQLASVLGLCMIGGALIAHLLAPTYGGALTYPGGPGTVVLGVPLAVVVPLATSLLFCASILLARRRRASPTIG
jgi:hypothetical protein